MKKRYHLRMVLMEETALKDMEAQEPGKVLGIVTSSQVAAIGSRLSPGWNDLPKNASMTGWKPIVEGFDPKLFSGSDFDAKGCVEIEVPDASPTPPAPPVKKYKPVNAKPAE